MKRKLRGFKRSVFELDFDMYRRSVPVPGVAGDRLSVIDIRPQGAAQCIVFVHGYAGCAETWEHQLQYFSKRYRVVAPDLRGHGQSDAPYSRYTMPELVGDLHAISQALELPEKFFLIGHSFGGSIAAEYAVAHPEQLERLVLIAAAGEYPLPKILSLVFRLPVAFFRPWWKYRPRWNAEVHVMKRMMLNNLIKWRGWDLMAQIKTTTLVITGERDNYFPRRVYDEVGQAVPGAEVVDVGASKHKVQLERAMAVNRAIERFVDESKRRATWLDGVLSEGLVERRPWLEAYPNGTPHTVPIPFRPLHHFLESAAELVPRRTATVFFRSRLRYSELNGMANQFGHALRGMGVRPGDRVMIVLPNMPEFVIAYYGILKIGGVVVLSNPDARAEQILKEIGQTGAKVLVTLEELAPFADVIRRSGLVSRVVLAGMGKGVPPGLRQQLLNRWRGMAGDGLSDGGTTAEPGEAQKVSALRMASLIEELPVEPPDVEVAGDALAAILFTSGTTDEPKGVSLSHANLVANATQCRHWLPDIRYGKETVVAVVPLLHAYGMTAVMNLPIAIGATIVLLPTFSVQHILEHIRSYRPTLFPGVPSMFAAINRAPNARDFGLSSIRACVSGAAPLPVEVKETFEKLTKGMLVEGYGATECSAVSHINPMDGSGKTGSIGVPIPNTDARVTDLATGDELPAGQIGELWIKGPQVMEGYWQWPEGTAERLKDGWFNTGDVAIADAEGYFHIIGRTRDVIRAGEHTVYPRDVEELIYEHNKVHEVAVVGVPRTSADQRVKAFVVPRPGATIAKEELMELCRRRLEPYAVPWEIEFRQELPRTFTGKVIRRLLVEE